ncbi:MAG: hypothetical protein V3V82_00275 [Acidimicrobiia bacterium]|jgi:hypothetical protein
MLAPSEPRRIVWFERHPGTIRGTENRYVTIGRTGAPPTDRAELFVILAASPDLSL